MDAGIYDYWDDEHPLHELDDDDKGGSKRKRYRPTTSYSLQSNRHIPVDLTVSGTKCILHRNDNAAKKIDDGKHMIDYYENSNEDASGVCTLVEHTINDWKDAAHADDEDHHNSTGSESYIDEVSRRPVLLMDRFDVRGLLENISDYEQGHSFTKKEPQYQDVDDDLSAKDRRSLEEERFCDFFKVMQSEDEKLQKSEPVAPNKIGQNHPPFHSHSERILYPSNLLVDIIASNKTTGMKTVEIFRLDTRDTNSLPDDFEIPASQRQFDIIKMAAKKSDEIPQFEVLLKVKQQNNPDFSFLDADDILHPFYQWIKNGKPDIRTKAKKLSVDCDTNTRSEAIGALAMYGSSSSDSEEDKETAPQKQPRGETFSINNNTNVNLMNFEKQQADLPEIMTCVTEKNSDVPVPSISTMSTDEQKSQRLKRAKLLRNHFLSKK